MKLIRKVEIEVFVFGKNVTTLSLEILSDKHNEIFTKIVDEKNELLDFRDHCGRDGANEFLNEFIANKFIETNWN